MRAISRKVGEETCNADRRSLITEADDSQLSGAEREDLLDKQPCLDALAELRHAKWFQVCTCICHYNRRLRHMCVHRASCLLLFI